MDGLFRLPRGIRVRSRALRRAWCASRLPVVVRVGRAGRRRRSRDCGGRAGRWGFKTTRRTRMRTRTARRTGLWPGSRCWTAPDPSRRQCVLVCTVTASHGGARYREGRPPSGSVGRENGGRQSFRPYGQRAPDHLICQTNCQPRGGALIIILRGAGAVSVGPDRDPAVGKTPRSEERQLCGLEPALLTRKEGS